jgi:primosomal protein N'
MKENILNQFMSKPGSILIGTESALSRISQEIDFSAIVSLDSLFSVPDYHISERIMYILTKMRSITRNTFIIQTRQIRERIFEYGRKGNLSDYYKNVINDRKTTNFPPFSTLIKFTIRGNKEKISNKMSELTALVSPNEIDVFPVFTKENKGRFAIHGLMKLPRGYWPNSELTTKLMGLDRDVEIKVNPENLL